MTSPSDFKGQLEDVYLTRKDIMNHFGAKGRRTVDTWMKSENFPKPIKLGGLLRWKLSEVAEWSANLTNRRNKEQSDE